MFESVAVASSSSESCSCAVCTSDGSGARKMLSSTAQQMAPICPLSLPPSITATCWATRKMHDLPSPLPRDTLGRKGAGDCGRARPREDTGLQARGASAGAARSHQAPASCARVARVATRATDWRGVENRQKIAVTGSDGAPPWSHHPPLDHLVDKDGFRCAPRTHKPEGLEEAKRRV